MSSSKSMRSQRVLRHFIAAAAALAFILAAFGAPHPRAQAQGLTYSSNSYVTPFPELSRYRLYVFGDSLGDGIWAGLYRAFKPDGNIDVIKRSRVSTGFSSTKKFDWNKHLSTILTTDKVHIAVIMTGVNDMAPIGATRTSKGSKIGTPEWRAIYGERIDRFIKQLKGARAAIYWVGLPIMRSAAHNDKMQMMNEIYRERAFVNGVRYIDTWNGFADQFGRYSAFGPGLTGQIRRLRASDGVHFTVRGYRKLAHFVEREIRRDIRKARSERDIPLAGNEAEQARAMRHLRPAQSQAGNRLTRKPAQRSAVKRAEILKAASIAARPSVRIAALPAADSTAAGIKLARPGISAAALAALSARYLPLGEVIAGDIAGGLTALASISPISDSSQAEAIQRLPLSQRPYYRVFVKGEELTPKPGRADDFTWRGESTKTR